MLVAACQCFRSSTIAKLTTPPAFAESKFGLDAGATAFESVVGG
jgi:hypothetical protein